MRILVADDDAASRRIVEAALRSFGHECDLAVDGISAWAHFDRAPYDVVITDREMPGMDGLELTSRIREHPTGRRAYVLLLTGLDSPGDALDGMTAGADDYLTKPLSLQHLQMRMVAAARLTALHQQLERLSTELERMALTDTLTSLGNRLALNEELERLHGMGQRYGHSWCLGIVDVDLFKAYNDTYGHLLGDRALIEVAKVLNTTGRKGDRAYRFGGEEFVLILPEQEGDRAVTALDRVRTRVHDLHLPHAGSGHHVVTVSIGAALLGGDDDGHHPDQVLALADAALYRAKAAGRNCVVTDWS